MIDLSGTTTIVTGGSRGLGFEMARTILSAGGSVALVGRAPATLKAAAQSLNAGTRVSIHRADVASQEQVEAAFAHVLAHHGSIDALVNNAGIAEEHLILDTPLSSWRRVIDTNLTAAFICLQVAARSMSPGGVVVNIASVDAHGADGPYASYVAAKTALLGLTRAAASELGGRGIRVVSVSPGWTLTDMAEESVTPEMLRVMRTDFQRAPLGRMTTPPEIANTVAFLLSDLASGITGEDIIVDGGIRANLYILESLDTNGTDAP